MAKRRLRPGARRAARSSCCTAAGAHLRRLAAHHGSVKPASPNPKRQRRRRRTLQPNIRRTKKRQLPEILAICGQVYPKELHPTLPWSFSPPSKTSNTLPRAYQPLQVATAPPPVHRRLAPTNRMLPPLVHFLDPVQQSAAMSRGMPCSTPGKLKRFVGRPKSRISSPSKDHSARHRCNHASKSAGDVDTAMRGALQSWIR